MGIGDEVVLVDDHEPSRSAHELERGPRRRCRAELKHDLGYVFVGEPCIGE
jgi:hypothetical protein